MAFVFSILLLALVALLVIGVRRMRTSRAWLVVVLVLVAALVALGYKYWTEEASNCAFDVDVVDCLVEQTRR